MARESRIVANIRRVFESEGAFVEKNHGSGLSQGRPDLTICFRGTYIAIEVKTPKGVVSAIQQYTLQEIRNAGGYAGVMRDVDDALEFLSVFPNVCKCLQRTRECVCGG